MIRASVNGGVWMFGPIRALAMASGMIVILCRVNMCRSDRLIRVERGLKSHGTRGADESSVACVVSCVVMESVVSLRIDLCLKL